MWWLEFQRLLLCFQAEDGIRDDLVTGVQTCALPIFLASADPCCSATAVWMCRVDASMVRAILFMVTRRASSVARRFRRAGANSSTLISAKIGRASCRERV